MPALAARRVGRARTLPAHIVWHDTAGGELAGHHLVLSQSRNHATPDRGGAETWRLERLHPNGALDWLPARPAPVLSQAGCLADLANDMSIRRLPQVLTPVAAFTGHLREYKLHDRSGAGSLSVLEGTLRGVAEDRPACRLILSGEAASMARLALALAGNVRLSVPREGLSAQALQVARGIAPAPRHEGAAMVPTDMKVADALELVCAHLADVILYWARRVSAGAGGEPVHQMRVGVRRLRSALSVFRRAALDEAGVCGWLDDIADRLRRLAGLLGVARDWDVFIAETGEQVRQAVPGDRRIDQLMAAAARKRDAAYAALAALFASTEWVSLEMDLALLPTLRPWARDATPAQAEQLATPLRLYASQALNRRLRHVLQPGDDLSALPMETLHDIRRQAKRLRYGIEIVTALFAEKPVRRYLRRLEQLQEILGSLNDTDVAASLVRQLGAGAGTAYAAGLVHGFGAAHAQRARTRLQDAWAKFYRAQIFWD